MLADPVSAMCGGLLLLGLGLVVGLMVGSARDVPVVVPPPEFPLRHVRPVRVGTCVSCKREGVEVELFSASWAMDPEDHCGSCRDALAREPGLTGGTA